MAEIRVKETGTIKLFESDNTSSVTIASPASLGADRTVTLPDASVTLVSGTMNDATALSGNIPVSNLNSGSSASSSTFWSGDGTWVAAGGDNTPAFMATASGNTSAAHDTPTKVVFDTEVFDTDGTYDHSTNYRFTPITLGKYFVTISLSMASTGSFTSGRAQMFFNGANTRFAATVGEYYNTTSVSAIIDVTNAADYIEAYWYQNSGGSMNAENSPATYFSAFKIIT